MDSDYNPLAHVITGTDGSYIFSPFPPGNNYKVFASVLGYSLATTDPFSLMSNQTVDINIVSVPDPSLLKSFIAGDIYGENNTPIFGSVVELYSISEKNEEILEGISFSNEFGQYAFREIEQGKFALRFSSLSYTSSRSTVSITADGSIAKVNSVLVPDPQASKGTVSGIISDNTGVAIIDADVILYRVEENEDLTPVAITKTIANGVYLFVNTPQGNYIVKSSKTYDKA